MELTEWQAYWNYLAEEQGEGTDGRKTVRWSDG
jgi:hypothetical protein